MEHAKSVARLGLAALAIFLFGAVAMVSKGPAAVEGFQSKNLKTGIAINGYDPVAYFIEDEAVKGSRSFQGEYDGQTYLFSSIENLDRFFQQPDKYVPQFGGLSVYGASRGKAYSADPEVFDIIDGNLYLSRNAKVRELWIRNPEGYIAKADKAWAELSR